MLIHGLRRTRLLVSLVLLVFSYSPSLSLAANSLDYCAEYAPAGITPLYTCTVDAHIVEPWLYNLPGFPGSTPDFLSETEAINYRIEDIRDGSENLCSEITYELSGYDPTWQFANTTTRFSFKAHDAMHRKYIKFNWNIRLNGVCNNPRSSSDYVYSSRTARCDNSMGWGTKSDDPRTYFCYQSLDKEVSPPDPPTPPRNPPPCQTCPCAGSPPSPPLPPDPSQPGSMSSRPIIPATGEKFRLEEDLASPEPTSMLKLNRVYRSTRAGGGASQIAARVSYSASAGSGGGGSGSSGSVSSSIPRYEDDSIPIFGEGWSSSLFGTIRFYDPTADFVTSIPTRAYLSLGDGRYRLFVRKLDGTWIPKGMHKDRLALSAPTDQIGYTHFVFQTVDSDTQYIFRIVSTPSADPQFPAPSYQAVLASIRQPNNKWIQIEHAPHTGTNQINPIKVLDHAGYYLLLNYTNGGQVNQISLFNPGSVAINNTNYTYDNQERLLSVIYSDGNYRQYHYENPQNAKLLTGLGWNGIQQEFYSYDDKGRAISSSMVNGIDSVQVDYSASDQSTSTYIYKSTRVIDPLGTLRTYSYTTAGHRLNVSDASLHGTYPEEPGVDLRERTVNSLGFVTSAKTFRNNPYSWTLDSERMLPTGTSEGNATRQRIIGWHPTRRLPTQIDETGGKRTTFTYDDNGNLLRQTITSTSGAAVNEVWTWTYTAQGLVATETDPIGAVKTFAYNVWGQLTSKTNPLGQVTTYAYNPAGLVSQINEPNGLVRSIAYTPRGWLTSSTLAGGGDSLTTAYTYTVDGQIKSVALPNGHTINYTYDAALRNTGWSDNRGQSAVYTLDPAGNATLEQFRNGSGQLAFQISRTISALNRVQSETVGAGIVETYTQDPNGRLASVTDATSKTTRYERDNRDLINRITDATGIAATIKYNAQDAVTTVVDFKTVTTNYTRDVQGNARSEATPDAGTTASTYDALGLPSRIVDALGRASNITRDALGRPTLITHSTASGTSATTPGGKTLTTQLRYDLSGSACNASGQANASQGRLCEVIDMVDGVTHATTQYQWDAFGRLTAQAQTLSSAVANHSNLQTTAFTYLASGGGQGELSTITYPSGSVLTHQYNATGRLTGLQWNGQPLIENITYNALDQPLSWVWVFGQSLGFKLPAQRLYNTAGQLTSAEFATFAPETTGRIGSVSQKLMKPNGAGGWAEEEVPFNAQYNALGQLTGFTAVGTSPEFQWGHTYSYDNNANRTGGTITANGASMSFTSGLTSNRLTNAAGITVTTNAAGDITSLLGKTMAYDSAGQLAEATAIPPCPSGQNCAGQQTTLSRFNGWGQRYLRDTPSTQTVFSYGSDGFNLLSETTRNLSTSALSTTEHIYLPTASGPMPIATVIDGVHFAVHSDHLNTPRKLSDAAGQTRWQWPYSGFGEIGPQSTPAPGQPSISYSLRYPGQVDDGNGLFYNWHRFYDPRVGRYTKADPIGLEGGFNRFGYVGGNPLSFVDSEGLATEIPDPNGVVPGGPWAPNSGNRPGNYLGPKPPGGGGRPQCQWVPPDGDGGPPGSPGYWKTNQPGESGWNRFDRAGKPITPEQAHPGRGGPRGGGGLGGGGLGGGGLGGGGRGGGGNPLNPFKIPYN
jgi:RHS repeat-associated protein